MAVTITKIATLLHVAYADELTDELRDIIKDCCADLRRDFDHLHARVRMVEVLEASNKHLTESRDEARRVARVLEVDRDAARDVAMDLAQMVVCSDYMPNETERALIETARNYSKLTKDSDK